MATPSGLAASVGTTLALLAAAACATHTPAPPPEPDPPTMNTFGFQEYALAIVRNDVGAVKSALAAGAEVDPRDSDQGSTPLIFAALFGRAEIAKLLIAAGADVHATDYNGVDALTLAELDWQSTETIAKAFGVPLLDPDAMKQGKAEITKLLRAKM